MYEKQLQTLIQMRDDLAAKVDAIDAAIRLMQQQTTTQKKKSTSPKMTDTFDLSKIPDYNPSGTGGIRL